MAALCVAVLLTFLFGVGGKIEEVLFSNSWAVEVRGGASVADRIAESHGFINRGQVSHTILRHSLSQTSVKRGVYSLISYLPQNLGNILYCV